MSGLSSPTLSHSELIDAYHKFEYAEAGAGRQWGGTKYFGTQVLKRPADMWLYQEVITEIKPALIIETGTWSGGSALFFAHVMDALSVGVVISIDLQPLKPSYPRHPRIDYWAGHSSTDPLLKHGLLRWQAHYGEPVMVILDSLHTKDHVLAELEIYAALVSGGSYLVVEDTNVGPNDVVFPEHGPGPGDALREWLPKHPDFKIDVARSEKFGYSYHTWLRRMRT